MKEMYEKVLLYFTEKRRNSQSFFGSVKTLWKKGKDYDIILRK